MNKFKKIKFILLGLFVFFVACSDSGQNSTKISEFSHQLNPEEITAKEQMLEDFLAKHNLDALLIGTQRNFSWITGGGDNHVVFGTEGGAAILLWSPEEKYVIAPTNEMPRITGEELKGLGYQPVTYDWYEPSTIDAQTKSVLKLIVNKKVGADFEFPGTQFMGERFAELRYQLTPSEKRRYAWLGKACAQIVESSCRSLEPGMTEQDIQAIVSEKLLREGIVPTVLLIAVDDRIYDYKHAITKTDTLKNYAMINICAKKWGLIIAVTRFVHFGELPEELSKNQEHVTDIYATILSNMKPGVKVADIFEKIQEAFNTHGFPEAWKQHHMGGAIGYKEREYKAYPGCDYVGMKNQAFAWNPTLPGAKVEDTIIVTDEEVKTLTHTGNWSYQTIEKNGQVFEVPQILVK